MVKSFSCFNAPAFENTSPKNKKKSPIIIKITQDESIPSLRILANKIPNTNFTTAEPKPQIKKSMPIFLKFEITNIEK